FTNAANGDYHVRPGSPTIDAGTSNQAPATDLDGQARPTDGNGDGTAAFDLGAYESPAAVNVPSDLVAVKTNDVSGTVISPNPWTWSISVSNIGSGPARFNSGQVILRDDLPGSGITYGAPTVSGASNITGIINCGISTGSLTCTAAGPVTIAASGSFLALV